MNKALHIIHPYTYQLNEKTLHLGGSINDKRDSAIGLVVNSFLDAGQTVYRHDLRTSDLMESIIHRAAVISNPYLRVLFDKRVLSFSTTQWGVPLPNDKPDEVPERDWSEVLKLFTTNEEYKQVAAAHDCSIFIGGLLERCLANAAEHHKTKVAPECRVCYVPEISVLQDEKEFEKAKILIQRSGIEELKFQDILALSI